MSTLPGGLGSPEKARALQLVVAEAVRTRDLQGAVARHGQVLSAQERSILQSLTPAELSALASVDAKLAPLGLSSLY